VLLGVPETVLSEVPRTAENRVKFSSWPRDRRTLATSLKPISTARIPSSEKTYVGRRRRRASAGAARLADQTANPWILYDTERSRAGWDVHVGLPALRRDWILSRGGRHGKTGKGHAGARFLKGKDGVVADAARLRRARA